CSLAACSDGELPQSAMVADSAGNLFGTTLAGGAKFDGTIFELTPKRHKIWNETILYSFCSQANCADGTLPNELMMDKNGNLFGTTIGGGTSEGGYAKEGVVFRLIPDGTKSTYDVLYNFCSQVHCTDGAAPQSGIAIDAAGNVFGTAMNGGSGKHDLSGKGGG